jgi:hypothetical protein
VTTKGRALTGNAVKDFHSGKRAFSQIPHLSTSRLNVGFPPMPAKSQRETRKTLQFLRLEASEKILHGVALQGCHSSIRSATRGCARLRPGL